MLYNDLDIKGLNGMSKKKIKTKFIILSIVLAIGLLLSFVSFPVGDYIYNGFAGSIEQGLEFKGGVVGVFEGKLPAGETNTNFDQSLDATVQRIKDLLASNRFNEANVAKQGSNQIRVEIADTADSETIFNLIGEPTELEFKKEDNVQAEAVLTGKNIRTVRAEYMNNQHGVIIEFDAEGTEIFSQLTQELATSNGSLHIFIGGTKFTSATINEQISNGTTFITGGMDESSAKTYALRILSGTFRLELELLNKTVISGSIGAQIFNLVTILFMVLGLLLVLYALYHFYGHLGLLAIFTLLFDIVLTLFFLQAVPLVQLSIPSMIGILLGFVITYSSKVYAIERVRAEYRLGKKVAPSVTTGFKKSMMPLLDMHIVLLIISISTYFIAIGAMRSLAITLLIGTGVSMLTSIVMFGKFANWYLVLNSTKADKLKLTREANIHETL